ncbi:hypothetical protein [Streptomyces puniciscabiei]|uniref:hypothetical protein n=1 Tax=Streptomyces puniciscabiei TaxID=164348 RepID=UPI0033310720
MQESSGVRGCTPLACGLTFSWADQDAGPDEAERGPAIHRSLERFDAVHVVLYMPPPSSTAEVTLTLAPKARADLLDFYVGNTDVLADWDDHLGQSPASLHDQRQTQEIADLRRQLNNNRQARQQLQDQVEAAATVIAVLLAENTALREQATKQSAVVIPLDRTHFISE